MVRQLLHYWQIRCNFWPARLAVGLMTGAQLLTTAVRVMVANMILPVAQTVVTLLQEVMARPSWNMQVNVVEKVIVACAHLTRQASQGVTGASQKSVPCLEHAHGRDMWLHLLQHLGVEKAHPGLTTSFRSWRSYC